MPKIPSHPRQPEKESPKNPMAKENEYKLRSVEDEVLRNHDDIDVALYQKTGMVKHTVVK